MTKYRVRIYETVRTTKRAYVTVDAVDPMEARQIAYECYWDGDYDGAFETLDKDVDLGPIHVFTEEATCSN